MLKAMLWGPSGPFVILAFSIVAFSVASFSIILLSLHFSSQTMMATLRKEYAAAKASKFEIEAAADAAARSAAAKLVRVF